MRNRKYRKAIADEKKHKGSNREKVLVPAGKKGVVV